MKDLNTLAKTLGLVKAEIAKRHEPKIRLDGHDQDRIDKAKAKRARRALKRAS